MPGPTDTTPYSWVDLSGIASIDGLIFNSDTYDAYGEVVGVRFGDVGSGATLTYSFVFGGLPAHENPYPEFNSWSALDADQQAAVVRALATWSNVANITFAPTTETSTNVGDLRFGLTGYNPTTVTGGVSAAHAYAPFEGAHAGDVWLNASLSSNSGSALGSGWGFQTLIHEIGHALGLKHPFESPYAFSQIGINSFDTWHYSVMSYTDPMMTPGSNQTFTNWPVVNLVATPQLLDIAAIQYLYGANMSYHTGDDTYYIDHDPGQAGIRSMTIWDAGGIDTLAMPSDMVSIATSGNAATDAFYSQPDGLGWVIDLRAGYSSSAQYAVIYSGRPFTVFSVNETETTIAYNVTIENAIGSSLMERIIGNEADNHLDARGGNDYIAAGAGSDTVLGGTGWDRVEGGPGADQLEGGLGLDTLWGGIGTDLANGGPGDDFINGNVGNDTVSGGVGADSLYGGAGQDLVLGGNGADYLEGNLGHDTLVGGPSSDTLIGNSGSDVFRYDAVNLGSGDVEVIRFSTDFITADATDMISMLGLIDDLRIGNVSLSALSSDAVLGSAFVVGQTNIAVSGGALRIDLNLDGAFSALSDFQIALTGVTTVTYFASDDLFHLA